MKRKIILASILACSSPTLAHNTDQPHAHYGGRIYYSAPCNKPRCRMCNDIRAQLRQPVVRAVSYPTIVVEETAEPFDPSSHACVAQLIRFLNLKSTDVVYDLGCGDGRILKAALPARGVGIEINPNTANLARRNCAGLPIRIVTGDATKYHLDGATHVVMYLFPDIIAKLVPRITKPGTVVVSINHPMPGVPNEVFDAGECTFYRYVVPQQRKVPVIQ